METLRQLFRNDAAPTLRKPEYALLVLLSLAGAAAVTMASREILSRFGVTAELATIIGFAFGSLLLFPIFSSVGRIGGREVRFGRFTLAVAVATAVFASINLLFS